MGSIRPGAYYIYVSEFFEVTFLGCKPADYLKGSGIQRLQHEQLAGALRSSSSEIWVRYVGHSNTIGCRGRPSTSFRLSEAAKRRSYWRRRKAEEICQTPQADPSCIGNFIRIQRLIKRWVGKQRTVWKEEEESVTYPLSCLVVRCTCHVNGTRHVLHCERTSYVTACDLVSNTRR